MPSNTSVPIAKAIPVAGRTTAVRRGACRVRITMTMSVEMAMTMVPAAIPAPPYSAAPRMQGRGGREERPRLERVDGRVGEAKEGARAEGGGVVRRERTQVGVVVVAVMVAMVMVVGPAGVVMMAKREEGGEETKMNITMVMTRVMKRRTRRTKARKINPNPSQQQQLLL